MKSILTVLAFLLFVAILVLIGQQFQIQQLTKRLNVSESKPTVNYTITNPEQAEANKRTTDHFEEAEIIG